MDITSLTHESPAGSYRVWTDSGSAYLIELDDTGIRLFGLYRDPQEMDYSGVHGDLKVSKAALLVEEFVATVGSMGCFILANPVGEESAIRRTSMIVAVEKHLPDGERQ